MKKIFIFLASLLGMMAPVAAGAQSFTGMWEIFPNYSTPKRMVETPEFVYVLAGTGLSGYDKSTGEVVAYNTGHKLNGNQVENIWYDRDSKCLLVAYTDYNIDLLFDDGRTVNVPDLRDASVTTDKTIRSAAFNKGMAYLGIGSGMLVIDMEHGAVTESCLWNKNVTRIMVTDNKILLCVGYVNPIYVADIKGSHHDFDRSFTASAKTIFPGKGWVRAGGNTIIAQHDDNASSRLYLIKVDPAATDNAAAVTTAKEISGTTGVEYYKATGEEKDNLQPTKNGAMAAGLGKVFYFDSEGAMTVKEVAAASGNRVADWNGAGTSVWLADATGFGRYDVAKGGFDIARTKPVSTSGANVGNFGLAGDGSLYIGTITFGATGIAGDLARSKTPRFDRYDNGVMSDITMPNTFVNTSMFSFGVNPNKNEYLLGGRSGLTRVNTSDMSKTTYNASNSTILDANNNGGSYVQDIKFDSKGNLYVLTSGDYLALHTINASAWNGNPQKADWKSFRFPQYTGNFSTRLGVHEDTGIAIATAKDAGLTVIDTKNNRNAVMPLGVDEDGMSLSGWNFPAIAVDKKGWVWVGGNFGLYVVRNPQDLFNTGYVPMRPKVSRDDGTNLADFLLDNVEIYCIYVDDSDQKWIGTIGSGLYRVSADGTQILDQFTTENSDIPSDNVTAVYVDGNSNKVYIGTDQGLCIYHATSAPASDSYDNVYAYPNPVTPDYTGWITITGLMDNSLVKIADASGRVFFEGRSDGGLATWNGCDASGNRVKSGVYFVFASQNNEGSSSAAVTKIVVIN